MKNKRILLDTHVHTSEISPCGWVPALEGVRTYKEAGYYGIIITDHYYDGYFDGLWDSSWEYKIQTYLSGYKSALEEGKKIGLQVFLGLEMRFQEGPEDYLVYGLNEEFLTRNPELYKHTLKSFREAIKDTGALIFQAHPYREGLKVAPAHLLDGMETHNGNPRHNSHNHKAHAYAKNHGLKMSAGSDFHRLEDLGGGGILIPEEIHSIEELICMYERKQVELYISDDM